MGNFIAGLILIYVTSAPLKDPSGTGQAASSRPVAAAYRHQPTGGRCRRPSSSSASSSASRMWVLVNRTAFGVLSSLAGRNPIMVVWQGARLSRLGLAGFVIGGALAGLAGTIEVLGPIGRLSSGMLPTHGFTAILIALVANLSVAGDGGRRASSSAASPPPGSTCRCSPACPPRPSTSSTPRSRCSSPRGPGRSA